MCFAAFKGWPCPTLFFNVHVRPSYMTVFSIVRKSFPLLTRGSLEKKAIFERNQQQKRPKNGTGGEGGILHNTKPITQYGKA